MIISKLVLKNFKSFRDAGVDLEPFMVLLGPNAAGKSNFIDAIKFLWDIIEHGLDNAVSMQGGSQYLRNINAPPAEWMTIEVHMKPNHELLAREIDSHLFHPVGVVYRISLAFDEHDGRGYRVVEDRLTVQSAIFKALPSGKIQKKPLGMHSCEIVKSGQKIDWSQSDMPQGVRSTPLDGLVPHLDGLAHEDALLQGRLWMLLEVFLLGSKVSLSAFDFDPRLPKKAIPVSGRMVLEPDGRNLALVLRGLLKNPEKRRKFINLLSDILPVVKGLGVEPLADNSLLVTLTESYFDDPLPASLISVGTINIVAILLALYFVDNSIIVIEEPERNIHPHLLGKLVEMMKDAAQRRQIIITTHNPEMVHATGGNHLFIVSRDTKGVSSVKKPDMETLKVFLENEIGLDQLHIQNLLRRQGSFSMYQPCSDAHLSRSL